VCDLLGIIIHFDHEKPPILVESERHGINHQRFSRDEFKANPGKYAPRLRGCDPVALVKSDLAVRGSVKFGAFYEGELFLFETADNRAAFRKDPVKFARLQHALKPEDVKKMQTQNKTN
jgi:YHS domain-containing protein